MQKRIMYIQTTEYLWSCYNFSKTPFNFSSSTPLTKGGCRKAVVKNDKLVGAVLLGPSNDSFFRKNIGSIVQSCEVEDNIKGKKK